MEKTHKIKTSTALEMHRQGCLQTLWTFTKPCNWGVNETNDTDDDTGRDQNSDPECLDVTRDHIIDFLHLFGLILSILENMKCRICHRLIVDGTILNCGHPFCKFCIISWLRLCKQCPTCLEHDARMICDRCFLIDACNDRFCPKINKIVTLGNTIRIITIPIQHILEFPTDLKALSNQMKSKTPILFPSVETRERMRIMTQNLVDQADVHSQSPPDLTILDRIAEVGCRRRLTIPGLSMHYISLGFALLSMTFSIGLLKLLLPDFLKPCAAVILTVHQLYFYNPNLFSVLRFGGNQWFWEQVCAEEIEDRIEEESNAEENFEMDQIIEKDKIDEQVIIHTILKIFKLFKIDVNNNDHITSEMKPEADNIDDNDP